MRGVDTNVLMRYITADDASQSRKAKRFIERVEDEGQRLYVSTIVVCELCWTLRGGPYRYDRPSIAAVVEMLLDTAVFEFQSREILQQALEDYRSGKADIADYLIGRQNRAAGCSATVTFDEKLASEHGFSML